MLSEEQISTIASKLNEKLDLPFLDEDKEQQLLERIMSGMAGTLEEVVGELPDPVREIWDRIADGISDEDAEVLIEQLTELANERIDIPFLDEETEADMVIRPAVSTIVETLRG